MNRRGLLRRFRNGSDIGSYVTVNFEIVGSTDLGTERIFFETDIHYLDIGEGEPVLLIHGIGQSLYTWRNNVDFLVKNGYRVIAPDLAGFGYSGHPNIYYTAEEHAIILKAFLDKLGIKRFHMAAFGGGCLSAVCIAAAHPKRTGKLVLISPGAPNPSYPFGMKATSTRLGSAAFKLIYSEASLKNWLQSMYFDATKITGDVLENYCAPYRSREVRETLCLSMQHFDDAHARSILKSVRSDTLVLSGVSDKLHGEEVARAYAGGLQFSKHIRIRNCAHLLHEEKHLRVNDEILRFLRKDEQESAALPRRTYQRRSVDK